MKNKKNALKVLIASCLALSVGSVYANYANTQTTKTTQTTTQNTVVPDSQITKTYTTAIKSDPITKDTAVTTTINNGVVTLKGEAKNDAEADALISKAESINGVTDTNTDDLTVKDSQQPLDDTIITAKIKGLFLKNQLMDDGVSVPSMSIHVETQDGNVLLTGDVDNTTQKQKAEEIAKSVDGVKSVKSSLNTKTSKAT